MPDPSWPGLPPEVNYLRLVGPGAAGTATTMANAVGWQAVAAGNEVALSQSMLNSAATAPNFEGVGGTSSLASVTGLNTWLQLLAAWAQGKPPVVASAVGAYEAAVSAMIPAAISLFNRTEQAANVAMNPSVFGALTPVIVALDATYFGEHWPHNAGIGVAYGAALAALAAALAIPVPISPPGASGVAPAAATATAAAAVAEAAGKAVAGEALTGSAEAAGGGGAAAPTAAALSGQTVMQPIQAMLGALQPTMGMFQIPMQVAQGLAGLPQSAAGLLGSPPGGAGPAALAGVPAGVVGVGAGAGVAGMGVGAGAGAGGIGTGVGGLPTSGITSYSRPASTFAPENAGRPTGHGGVGPGAAEWRGPTTTGGGLPVGPAGAGMLARGKETGEQDCGPRARVVADLVVEDGRTRQTGFRTGP